MKSSRFAVGVSALAFVGMVVSGCSGGGVDSTPTPSPTPTPGPTPTPTPTPGSTPTPSGTPTPTPTPTYLTMDQVNATGGNKLFNTTGVKFADLAGKVGLGKFADSTTFTFQYLSADNTYRVSFPTSTPTPTPTPAPTPTPSSTATPTPTPTSTPMIVNFDASSGTTVGQTTTYTKTAGGATDTLQLIVPQQDGVNLTYTRFLSYDHDETGTAADWRFRTVYGVLTYIGNRPTSGTATYTTTVLGSATRGSTDYLLSGNSTGTFSVDFGKTGGSEITTTLNLKGQDGVSPLVDFGTVNGTGTITGATGVGFTGTLTNTTSGTGAFGGAFFGPFAAEFGYAWYFNGSDFNAEGFAGGKKNP